MSLTIFAGLVSQFPLSWLSDRYDRQRLLFYIAALLALACLPLVLLPRLSFHWVLGIAFLASMVQFALYPLQVALANDQVAAEQRVSLTACLLMAFGIGASIGPLLVGSLMQPFGSNILYLFFTVCTLLIAVLSYVKKAPLPLPTTEVPLPHVVLPDSLATSPLGAALNPVLEDEAIQAAMVTSDEEGAEDEGENEDEGDVIQARDDESRSRATSGSTSPDG